MNHDPEATAPDPTSPRTDSRFVEHGSDDSGNLPSQSRTADPPSDPPPAVEKVEGREEIAPKETSDETTSG